MQGFVKDDKGAYVKSAIVRLLKISDAVGESKEEAVTYAETDEEGRFVIGELDPEERYIIEVHIEIPEPPAREAEPEDEPEPEDEAEQEDESEDEAEQEYGTEVYDEPEQETERELADGIIDSLNFGSTIVETIKVNLCVNSLYNIGFDPKDKPYLTKNNTW
jgi:hypothetical protein